MRLPRRPAETARLGDRADVPELLEFHRWGLFVLCELYIGCLDAHGRTWRGGESIECHGTASGSVQAVAPDPGAPVAPSRRPLPRGDTHAAIRG